METALAIVSPDFDKTRFVVSSEVPGENRKLHHWNKRTETRLNASLAGVYTQTRSEEDVPPVTIWREIAGYLALS
jgi:hypothetical protein